MATFFTTLLVTLPLFIGAALLFNFSKKRIRKTKHGLTGMCHDSGGTMCCSCASQVQTMIRRADRKHPIKST
jgi:hypothetical protein